MYNRTWWIRLLFDCAQGWLKRIHSELLTLPKINAHKPVTDGYTIPLHNIWEH